jgi:glycosyltransferase involved in cell wall biosynthesis
MKLFYDARYIRTDFHDGVSRYSTELANAVAELHDDTTFIICDEQQLNFLPPDAKHVMFFKPTAWREAFASIFLNKYQPDVVFSPMQTIGSMGKKFKLIVTVHDLIYYRHRTPPRGLSPLLGAGWWLYHLSYVPQRLILRGANMVATVSDTSRQHILDVNMATPPIPVIPNAPQRLQELVPHTVDTSLPPINLVYMGSFMPYKNVETLVKGMEFLPNYQLHLLSRTNEKTKAKLRKLQAPGVEIVFHNGVSDKEYAELLTDRSLLVSASLDEGYGLPLAESLALGVPVVASDLPIFHEVAGQGALYFEPTSPRDFADKVIEASAPDRYKLLSLAGKKHIAKFNWLSSAETLIESAHELLAITEPIKATAPAYHKDN